ncbi:MAG: YciI family protein [Rhodospirillales bacterium]
MEAYTEALVAAGVMVGGNGLEPPSTSTTLRVRDGKRQVQDGPYADTKEQLGGYYIINVPISTRRWTGLRVCPAPAPARSKCGRS